MRLIDRYNRKYTYLRLSVTDRCNYKCKYCHPINEFVQLQHKQILTYEDLLFIVSELTKAGVEKIRLTGGEPLVRKGLTGFIKELASIRKIKEVTLTTNGSLLHLFAEELKKCGVNRINISLDSLIPGKYAEITGGFNLQRILENIKLANKLGFKPIKINTVLMKGFNDDEILDFCEFAAKTNTFVRFIEFMPVGENKWDKDKIIKKEDVLKIISSKYSFKKIEDHYNITSTNYQLSNGGIIGLITPITNHFCKYCNKIRILANGNIRPCLLSNYEISLFDIIKKRDSENFLKTIQKAIDMKPKNHNIIDKKGSGNDTPMSSIGG